MTPAIHICGIWEVYTASGKHSRRLRSEVYTGGQRRRGKNDCIVLVMSIASIYYMLSHPSNKPSARRRRIDKVSHQGSAMKTSSSLSNLGDPRPVKASHLMYLGQYHTVTSHVSTQSYPFEAGNPWKSQPSFVPLRISFMANAFLYSTGLMNPTVGLPAASLSSLMRVIIAPQSGVAADVPDSTVCWPCRKS